MCTHRHTYIKTDTHTHVSLDEHKVRNKNDMARSQKIRILETHKNLGEAHGTGFFLTVKSRNQSCRYLDFRLLASETVRQYISVLSHPICSLLKMAVSKLRYHYK